MLESMCSRSSLAAPDTSGVLDGFHRATAEWDAQAAVHKSGVCEFKLAVIPFVGVMVGLNLGHVSVGASFPVCAVNRFDRLIETLNVCLRRLNCISEPYTCIRPYGLK